MYDLIIIGAGPAGLTSALYALRANKKVLILESKCYGGQIVNASNIENYPGISNISGFDYANTLYNQVINLGAELKYEKVIGIDEERTVKTDNSTYQSKSIIIATGVNNRKLEINNENELIGKGISYCATCDGNFYKEKIVAVVGGGNTALTDALYLSGIAKKVYLIHRKNVFRGDAKYISELKNKENVEFILNSNIIKINGMANLESIDIKDSNDNISNFKLNGLFIGIGQVPNNELFSNIIELDDSGYIKSDDGVHTNIEGIYVAGDARVKNLRQLVTAVSDGANAATTAIEEMR